MNTMNENEAVPATHDPIHPAEVIFKPYELEGFTVEEVSAKTGLSMATCILFQRRKIHVSDRMAEALGRGLGTSKELWVNLQTQYDTDVERLKREMEESK